MKEAKTQYQSSTIKRADWELLGWVLSHCGRYGDSGGDAKEGGGSLGSSVAGRSLSGSAETEPLRSNTSSCSSELAGACVSWSLKSATSVLGS